jgi:hypothetical protein
VTETVHLIVRVTDEGLYATSPQAPGLAYGCATLTELRSSVQDVLAFHYNRPGPFDVIEHHERHYDFDGRELITRLAYDEHRDERQEVYARLGAALTLPEQARSLTTGPTNRAGEAVYVCAVSSDTIGWLADQLDPRGEAVTVAVAEPFIFTVPFAYGEDHPLIDGITVAENGHTLETTIGEIARRTPIVKPVTAHHTMIA